MWGFGRCTEWDNVKITMLFRQFPAETTLQTTLDAKPVSPAFMAGYGASVSTQEKKINSIRRNMMTSWQLNALFITATWWEQSTGDRWIPITRCQQYGYLMLSLLLVWTRYWKKKQLIGWIQCPVHVRQQLIQCTPLGKSSRTFFASVKFSN